MNSVSKYTIKGALALSGLLAGGIAAMILFAPGAFYASYGIDVASNVDLLNELKAPAGLLLVAAAVMLYGVFVSAFAGRSLAVAALVFSSYGFSRVLSISIDGTPNAALVSAALLEIVLGAVCFWGYRRVRSAGHETPAASVGEGVA